ncbi:MAG: hypothetical protein WCO37_11590 [Bacteroidota bacterium]
MKVETNTIESLVKGGFLGAAFGALLSKDKEEGALIGALLGAAFYSTLKANEEAQKTDQPVLVAEEGKLYRILPGGKKEFVKDLPKGTQQKQERFKLT